MPKKIKCEDCGDKGWLIIRNNELEVQRCDNCNKCTSDLAAAVAFFNCGSIAQYYHLGRIVIHQSPIQEGHSYRLNGFGDDRDGKVVQVLALADNTAIVDAPDYRANISTKRLEPII